MSSPQGVFNAIQDSVASSTATGLTQSLEAGPHAVDEKSAGTISVTTTVAGLDVGAGGVLRRTDQRLNNVSHPDHSGVETRRLRTIDFALDQLNSIRSGIGAVQKPILLNHQQLVGGRGKPVRSPIPDSGRGTRAA